MQGGNTEIVVTITNLKKDVQLPMVLAVVLAIRSDIQKKKKKKKNAAAVQLPLHSSKEHVLTPQVGLPGGLEPRHEQLRELVKAGTIASYEVKGRELCFYLYSMAPGQVPAVNRQQVCLHLYAWLTYRRSSLSASTERLFFRAPIPALRLASICTTPMVRFFISFHYTTGSCIPECKRWCDPLRVKIAPRLS
jgi:hypothetical protein